VLEALQGFARLPDCERRGLRAAWPGPLSHEGRGGDWCRRRWGPRGRAYPPTYGERNGECNVWVDKVAIVYVQELFWTSTQGRNLTETNDHGNQLSAHVVKIIILAMPTDCEAHWLLAKPFGLGLGPVRTGGDSGAVGAAGEEAGAGGPMMAGVPGSGVAPSPPSPLLRRASPEGTVPHPSLFHPPPPPMGRKGAGPWRPGDSRHRRRPARDWCGAGASDSALGTPQAGATAPQRWDDPAPAGDGRPPPHSRIFEHNGNQTCHHEAPGKTTDKKLEGRKPAFLENETEERGVCG